MVFLLLSFLVKWIILVVNHTIWEVNCTIKSVTWYPYLGRLNTPKLVGRPFSTSHMWGNTQSQIWFHTNREDEVLLTAEQDEWKLSKWFFVKSVLTADLAVDLTAFSQYVSIEGTFDCWTWRNHIINEEINAQMYNGLPQSARLSEKLYKGGKDDLWNNIPVFK